MEIMRIDEYEVATAPSVEELNEKVKEMIKRQWQPYGSGYAVSVTVVSIGVHFCQPMVKGGW